MDFSKIKASKKPGTNKDLVGIFKTSCKFCFGSIVNSVWFVPKWTFLPNETATSVILVVSTLVASTLVASTLVVSTLVVSTLVASTLVVSKLVASKLSFL